MISIRLLGRPEFQLVCNGERGAFPFLIVTPLPGGRESIKSMSRGKSHTEYMGKFFDMRLWKVKLFHTRLTQFLT